MKIQPRIERLKSRWAKRADRWAARHISPDAGYVFTVDYLEGRIALWEQYLGELKGRQGVRFLEIGSYEGRSAVWFLDHILTDATASIVCLDIFTQHYGLRFDHNICVSGAANKVTKIKGRSEEVLAGLPPTTFDFIYIDGSHHALNVLMDAVAGWRLLKPRGIMMFDDYLWQIDDPPATRPQMAIDLFLSGFEPELEILHHGEQVIVRKRPTQIAVAGQN